MRASSSVHRKRSLALQVGAVACLAAVAVLAAASACSSYSPGATTAVVGPDFGQFKGTLPDGGSSNGVSQLLQKRCGTLDCHGQPGRPLRIYGANDLRLDDGGDPEGGNVPGGAPTTPAEYLADYESVIGLQPELMTEVVHGTQPPESLLLLRKPLQLERHKGGAVIVEDDSAYNCIVSWLQGRDAGFDYGACTLASQ
jgi:hypothetical protein